MKPVLMLATDLEDSLAASSLLLEILNYGKGCFTIALSDLGPQEYRVSRTRRYLPNPSSTPQRFQNGSMMTILSKEGKQRTGSDSTSCAIIGL